MSIIISRSTSFLLHCASIFVVVHLLKGSVKKKEMEEGIVGGGGVTVVVVGGGGDGDGACTCVCVCMFVTLS